MKLTEYKRESAKANLFTRFDDAIGESPKGITCGEIINEFQKALSQWQIAKGKCPVCKGELEHGNSEIIDEQVCFKWVCTDCEAVGKEWHNLVFTTHTYTLDATYKGDVA